MPTAQFSPGNVFLVVEIVYKSLLQRGQIDTEGTSCRYKSYPVLHLMLNIFSLLMFISYTGLLTSFMATRPKEASVKTFQDIYDMKLELYTMKDSSNVIFLSEAPYDSAMNKIYREQIMGNDERLTPTDNNRQTIDRNYTKL